MLLLKTTCIWWTLAIDSYIYILPHIYPLCHSLIYIIVYSSLMNIDSKTSIFLFDDKIIPITWICFFKNCNESLVPDMLYPNRPLLGWPIIFIVILFDKIYGKKMYYKIVLLCFKDKVWTTISIKYQQSVNSPLTSLGPDWRRFCGHVQWEDNINLV